jgi:TolB-like protein/Flp pilus assembly protein TadD
MSERTQRRLAAIVAADVAGYSRLIGDDEEGTLRALRLHRGELIDPLLAEHGGRIANTAGDSLLLEFSSVVDAVRCSVAMQEGMAARNRDVEASRQINFRVGIHVGDVVTEGDDMLGDGVNVAARLEALAEPGGLCLSEDAHRQVRSKIDANFEDGGVQKLKNITEPMRVFRLAGQQELPAVLPTAEAADQWHMPRVLLVPFRHLGASGDAEALAAGVTETLAAALSHFEEFELVDPRSATDLIAAQGAREAGRQLGATYVLEGSLQLGAGRARIGVQLIDVAQGERVWSETKDYELEDVFALQDDITAFVASTLGEAVGEEQARAIAQKTTGELSSYEVLVRGIQHLHRANPEDNRIARGLFEQALDRAPDHYFPTLCLCWTYAVELINGWPSPREDAIEYCLGLLRDILRRHDRSAQAHRLMGRLLIIAGDQEKGLAHTERAYQLNPYNSDMMTSYGFALLWNGRTDEALRMIERGLKINPYAPPYYKAYLSLACFLAGRHQDGLDALKGVEGAVGPSRYARIANLSALERLEEAQAEARIVMQENPDFDLERLLAAYPFKQAEDRQRLGEALRHAGLGAKTTIPDAVDPSALPLPDKPSIAVLPFDNMSGDPEQEYFSDGITEDIITNLSRIRWLFVIARNSSFVFKGKAVDVRQVSSELGVRYVLEGSVRKAANKVRISVQLIDAQSSAHLWAERYDRDLTDIFAVQDEITENVAGAIEPAILAAEGLRARSRSGGDIGAWDMLMQAISAYLRLTKEDSAKAIALLEAAVARYPEYGPAHSMLSFALLFAGQMGWTDLASVRETAGNLAQKGFVLDDQDPWAHVALGYMHAMGRRSDEAILEYTKAIELSPSFAAAYGWRGFAKAHAGLSEEAIADANMALRLSPKDPLNAIVVGTIGLAHYLTGRNDEAIRAAEECIRLRPGFLAGQRLKCAALAQSGRISEAQAALEIIRKLQPDVSASLLRRTLPYSSPENLEKFIDGLRKAGLPE